MGWIEEVAEMAKLARMQAESITDDTQAYNVKMVYPEWVPGTRYTAGQYRNRNGELYKCLVPNISQEGWEPENAPSLWAKVLPGQAGAEIGEWAQPDSTNAYMAGDKVTHNEKTWVSDIDYNVWEPGVYGWSEYAKL